jgi:hypothetical protein
MSYEPLIGAYLRSLDDNAYFWAYKCVDDIVRYDPEQAWTLMLQIVAAAPSEDVLHNIGAGHLEDLLKEYGLELMERITHELASNKKLLSALYCTRLPNEEYPAFASFQKLRRDFNLDKSQP